MYAAAERTGSPRPRRARAVHVGEPRREPQALQRLEARLAHDQRRARGARNRAREDAPHHRNCSRQRLALAGQRALRHDEEHQHRRDQTEHGRGREQTRASRAGRAAPARARSPTACRCCRCRSSSRSAREPLARKPERERLDRSHQAGRHAQADQRAADRQHGQVARQTPKISAPAAATQSSAARAAPRAEAVERTPSGSWHAANESKYALVSRPEVGGRRGRIRATRSFAITAFT